MRRIFTTADAYARGITPDELRWGERSGRWRRIRRGIYGEGSDNRVPLDQQRALVLARSTVARGRLGGVLLGLDSVFLDDRPTRESIVAVGTVVEGMTRTPRWSARRMDAIAVQAARRQTPLTPTAEPIA